MNRPLAAYHIMKKLLLLLPLYLINPGASALPSFDPFADASGSGGTTYTPGSNLVGQNNNTLFGPWYLRGGNSGTTQPTIVSGNLVYGNMPAATGNSVSFAPANSMSACMDLNLASGHTNAVYASFLLKINDLSAVASVATNNPLAAFGDDPSLAFTANQIGRLGSRLLTKRVGEGYVLGISRSAGTADYAYEPDAAAHSTNEVLFVVLGYDRPTAAQPTVSLWVNPPLSSLGSNQPPAATVVASSGLTALNTGNARVFAILCQFAGAPGGRIDEVRVATNDWAFATGGDPAILTPPANRSVPPGNNANFTVVARGTPSLSYQWIKDGTTLLVNGGKISGANTASLTINNISVAELGTYAVFVTNGVGNSVLSSSATLSFLTDPSITNQPQDFAGNFGTNATFQVTAGGTPPFSYQWHKEGVGDLSDGGNISGSHSSVLTVTGISFPDSGNYTVTVSNSLGAVESTTAVLTVADPYVNLQPISLTTNAGAAVTFQVGALGSGVLTYQWLKNGNLIFDTGNYSGATTPTLTISNVSAAEQATYSATVIGPYTNAVSSGALLNVLTPASVSIQPRARAVLAGVKTAFAVGPGGSGPFTYQWQRDGADISGATAAGYVVTNAQANVTGNYRVVISNSFSSVTSAVAALTVSNSLSLAESNLVIIRVGDGAQGLTVNGSAMFLDQFAGDGSYVNTITIPDEGPSAMAAIGWDNINGVNSGSTTGNSLTRSLDGRFMVLAGYNTNLNYGGSLMLSSATNVPKGIALIDSLGNYNLAVVSTNPVFDGSFWRAAVTDGSNNFWGISGIAGTYYFGFDDPAALVQNTFINSRSMGLFNGNIYCAAAAAPTGLLKLNGMPRTADTPTVLFNASSGTYDMAVSPNGNLIYLTDQRNVANGGGVQRYDFDGSTWTLTYTLTTGFGSLGPRYIAADFSGPNPVLYVTSNDQTFDNNRLIKFVDTGAGSAGSALAVAGVNQTFRGLHFGPVPSTVSPRPQLSYARIGNNLVLSWSGPFTLMSASAVAGPYSDVAGATSPYTNNVTTPLQRYFGLRQ